MGEKSQLVEVRVKKFVLVGGFVQEDFVLNYLPFMKWNRDYQLVQTN